MPSAAISQAAALREGVKRAAQSKRNQVEPEGAGQQRGTPQEARRTLSRVFGSGTSSTCCRQSKVRKFYKKDVVQMIVAVIIILNFLGNILEKSIDAPPFGEKHASTWQVVEDVFNYIFCARCRPPAAAARAPSAAALGHPLGGARERLSASAPLSIPAASLPPLAALAPASCAPFLAG